jgi:hypothetical protein
VVESDAVSLVVAYFDITCFTTSESSIGEFTVLNTCLWKNAKSSPLSTLVKLISEQNKLDPEE